MRAAQCRWALQIANRWLGALFREEGVHVVHAKRRRGTLVEERRVHSPSQPKSHFAGLFPMLACLKVLRLKFSS